MGRGGKKNRGPMKKRSTEDDDDKTESMDVPTEPPKTANNNNNEEDNEDNINDPIGQILLGQPNATSTNESLRRCRT